MSQCTCTKDAEITCIVHPTERALKERIAELEKVAEAAVIVCQLVDEKSSMVYGLLERPLQAAGYLK